jgi:excisionase family DNA binding protein
MPIILELPDYAPDLGVWSWLVKRRDNYICQKCKQNMPYENLHAHHIDKDPKKQLLLCNGTTLCRNCHNDTHHNNYLTLSQVAVMLKLKESTVLELLETKILLGYKIQSCDEWRIDKKDFDAYLQSPC